MFFKKYDFGDVSVYYIETPVEGTKKTTVGMAVYPKGVSIDPKKLCCDSLVQVAFTGDEALTDYSMGVTMRNRSSTILKVSRQVQFMSGTLNTYLEDGNGNEYVHKLFYERETGVFTVNVRYDNRSKESRILEHLSSFSISGISSPSADFTSRGLVLHRIMSSWRRKSDSFAHLFDVSRAPCGVKVEKWGQAGYYPFAGLECPDGFVVGVQMDAPFSWQMEVFGGKETSAISGGIVDFEFGHWRKEIPAGGSFTTPCARFTLKQNLSEVCNAFLREQDSRLHVPASENEMPVLFYEENPRSITRILKTIKTLPIDYFVIGKGWESAVGDWNENEKLFPDGIKKVSDKIREAGKLPGICFEFETAERSSECFHQEGALLKRDGRVITTKNRRFLDLRLPEVKDYLHEKILRFLKENGFGYIKIDYNDSFGFGCDGAESLGEGGRQIVLESLDWLDRLKQTVPELVIENCSSGGSRNEPLRMSKVSMCSISDAHDCAELPLVAANVSRAIPARQSQIRAVIQKDEPDCRTIYTLCAAMMGRICLSGEIQKVTPEKLELIAHGLEFYQYVKEIVRRGEITAMDCDVESYRGPKGRQVYIKQLGRKKLVIVHFLECENAVRIPLDGYAVKAVYTDLSYGVRSDTLRILGQSFHAGAFLLEKSE